MLAIYHYGGYEICVGGLLRLKGGYEFVEVVYLCK